MTWEEFVKQCQPLTNTIQPTDACGGFLFDTTPEELQVLKEHLSQKEPIATLCDSEGETFIQPGYHFVNALGYFLLTYEMPEDQEVVFEENNENEDE